MALSTLSNRGQSYIEPAGTLLSGLLGWAANPYHPETNKEGIINCGTAENALVSDWILPVLSTQQRLMTEKELKYDKFEGSTSFKAAIAGYLEMVLKVPIEADMIASCAGTGSAVNFACCCIGDEGDGCIIPAPYYGAFDFDVCKLAKLKIIRANRSPDDDFQLRINQLEEAYQNAFKSGVNVRMLLLTSPDNPTGIVYSKELLVGVYQWAKSHNIHILCDEIYASSIYNGKFISILQAIYEENLWDEDYAKNYVHLVYGFAKDFGMSGFRVGLLYTRNSMLKESFCAASMFASVSRQTQFGLCGMLENKEWLQQYLSEYKVRLREAADVTSKHLKEHGIVFHSNTGGGLFCILDLRSHLKEPTWEDEMKLYEHIFAHKLYCNPGKPFAFPSPGFFRIIFSQSNVTIEEAIRRLAKAISSY